MGPTEGLSGAEHYQRGKEYYRKNDFDHALPEFVRAIQKSPDLVQNTDIIGEWHDCMMFCLKFNQHWFPYLQPTEEIFQMLCESIYTHLKNSNYGDVERFYNLAVFKLPVLELPETERHKCHASLLAERAMALFGLMITNPQNDEVAGEGMREAIASQIAALNIDPEVRLTYRMRPRIRK
ncbi:MAG: hypothetical protein E4G91_03265 [Candidatus Zixiibacteriota bacterium]|nr:MAG: hypothetical protein E4G91_03265 [candidate division Zixibacteria bacterium]